MAAAGDDGITHRDVEVNGVRLHIAEAGPAGGPVVLLLHGFPELWYTWRHQMPALAAAGYRAVAPDLRGYGGSDAPAVRPEQYTALHVVGDLVALLDSSATTGCSWWLTTGAPSLRGSCACSGRTM
jgi:pimeloyl-ACP methyl ester carboxylesterase